MTEPVKTEESVHAPDTSFGARRPRLLSEGELLLIAVFFLTALTSIAVTRNVGGSSLLWPANAIAAAVLVRWPTLRWGRVLAGLLVG